MLRLMVPFAVAFLAVPAAGQVLVPAAAQTPAVPVPGAPAAEPVDPLADPMAAVLAFTDYDARMSVPVRVNGAGPYRFIIDTGAERTVISHQVAGMLGLAAGRTINIAAMTGSSAAATVMIPSLEIDAVQRGLRIEAPSLDRAHLGADGLVGIDSLADSAVQIDFEVSEMRVARAFRRRREAAPGEIVVRAKTLAGRLIVSNAFYAGKRISVILDTGTSISIGNARLLDLIRARSSPLQPVHLTGVTGGVLMAEHHQVPRVTVGDAEFQHLAIAFADVAPFRRLGLEDRPALFLGMDALRLFRRVRIDFANREVRFLMPHTTLLAASSMRGRRMP